MPLSSLGVLHGIFNGSSFISQIQNARATTDIQNLIAQSAGLPYPLFTGPMSINPGVSFETTQLKTILDSQNVLAGICDLSAANTDLYFKAVVDFGRRLADASGGHIRFRMAQAYMALNSITASHNSEAVASCYIGTTYDGSNAPLVAAGSQVLAGTPSSAQHWTTGPISLNTTQVPGVQDVTIDFGRQLFTLGADGEIYPTFVGCQFYAPTVTFRTYTHVWQTYGIVGTALTSLAVYLRSVVNTGRDADGTATHIKFSATKGTIQVDEATGGNNDPSMVTVKCTLVSSSATTEPISVNTASAIT